MNRRASRPAVERLGIRRPPPRDSSSIAIPGSQVENTPLSTRNPCDLAPPERLSEIAALLATGYARHLARRGANPLDSDRQPERSCAPVHSPESPMSRDAGDRPPIKEIT